MENIWNMFKQRTLDLQHVFHNMMIQSINQSTHPRENMVFNEFEDQQLQQAMALSMGQNVQNVVNYRNDIFPPPLPPSPNEYIRENHHEMMDDDTPFEDRQDEEEELRRVLQESLEDAKERGIVDKNEKIEVNNNKNDLYEENLDDIGEVIMQIRKERNSQDQRKRLLREQEEAYQESLRQDNLKKQEEQRKIQEMQERERELEMKKEMEEAILLSKELSKKQKIEKVTMNVPIEPSKTEKDIVEIVVRLTDGTKVSRRFKLDNTLNQLHNWITSLSDQSRHIPDLFSISSSFPRKKFTDLHLTFKDAGLTGSVLLFIEEEDEEDN